MYACASFEGVGAASPSAARRQNTLSVRPRVCVCVPVLCAELMNPSLKAVLLPSCLPCHYNYKGHLTLKPHSLSPRLHMWPVFLLQLNDWMHLHRFLLTSSPIWNLVPVRSAQNEHTHSDAQAHTHMHTHTSKAEITKGFVCALSA